MEAPLVARELDSDDKALKSLLDSFGSAFSLEEIASTYCKANRDGDLAGEILHGMQTRSPSANAAHVCQRKVNCETSSKTTDENDYAKSIDANKIGSKSSELIQTPAKRSVNGENNVRYNVRSDTNPLKAAPVYSNSSVHGRNCVWRVVGSNGTPNGTQSLKVEANSFLDHVNTSEESLLSKDANSDTSDGSSSASSTSLNDDTENFLFEMFGRGFQLERSAIREVLGHCGHDMKKSMETLLDLTAVTLDKRYNFCKGNNQHSDSKSISFEKQKSAESNVSRTKRTTVIPTSHSSERYIHTPEQPHLTVMSTSGPVLESDARTRTIQAAVNEPLVGIADYYKVKTTSPQSNNLKDDVKEGSYDVLRKEVKEHRETMKGYYKAAAEAFARGDRGQAVLLLEKGQFFHDKAREADEESASKIFETSRDSSVDGKTQDEMLLDLQEHDAKEAISLVKLHLRTLSGIPLVSDLKLIIGNGDRDAEKRKRLILKLLKKEAIKWTEDENSSAILIHLSKINPRSLSFGKK